MNVVQFLRNLVWKLMSVFLLIFWIQTEITYQALLTSYTSRLSLSQFFKVFWISIITKLQMHLNIVKCSYNHHLNSLVPNFYLSNMSIGQNIQLFQLKKCFTMTHDFRGFGPWVAGPKAETTQREGVAKEITSKKHSAVD